MLKELRQKPKQVRENYAFWGAFSITAVIALVWALSVSIQFGPVSEEVATTTDQPEAQNDGAFSRSFSDIKNNVAGAWQAFTDASKDGEAVNDGSSTTDQSKTPENSSSSATSTATSSKPRPVGNQRSVLIATTTLKTASSTQ